MSYKLNLKQVTYALSEALDLVGIDDNMHGKRVAYMAVEVAKKLSWSDKDIDELYAIGMLHDCGVSSTDVHTHLVTELDWNQSDDHCKRGSELVSKTTHYKKYT
ncbi:MAG: HD domain-containing protein [Campylobacterota bacterium]|nr:HD domain-containing protein [Campylobacterota bacterium]